MSNPFIDAYLKIITESRKDDYTQQLENKGVENASEMANYLFQYNNPKKEKAALYWLLRGTIKLPEDQYKVDEAFNLIEKQHLDFQKFDNPMSIINREDKSTKRIKAQSQKFDPNKEPTFSNKKDLGNGVVVYQVKDSKEAQLAVRKAIDSNWGYDKNPWCLAARKSGFDQNEVAQLSEDEQEKLGRYSEDELETAWHYWNKYNTYPKRIAFKNGKLLAFCANNENKITWWNKNDKSSVNIPEVDIEDDLEFIKKYTDYNIYLAQNPKTSSEVLMKLANNEDNNIRMSVAKNPNTSVEILEKLANDKDWQIRLIIAKNQKAPKEVLMKLADDKDNAVKESVASNSNTPIKVLEKLADDKDWQIRIIIAKNQKVPKEVLMKLADDKDNVVKEIVASNSNTPKETLKKLVEDEDLIVRRYVALNSNAPKEILEKLADDDHWLVRHHVASNKNTPKEILEKLSNDKDKLVRDKAKEKLGIK